MPDTPRRSAPRLGRALASGDFGGADGEPARIDEFAGEGRGERRSGGWTWCAVTASMATGSDVSGNCPSALDEEQPGPADTGPRGSAERAPRPH
jgi:hypothetical protein